MEEKPLSKGNSYFLPFKKEVGISVMNFFNKLRIDKSLFYLEKTEFPVHEIANQVGIHDSNYFSRLFKKYMKSSSTEYRL